jgi:mono/diheme cytochrome c family protein
MRAALLALVALVAFATLVAACRERPQGSAARRASDAAPAVPAFVRPVADGKQLVADDCLMCHREEMLRQQRLTVEQWAKVVKKMSGWGAPIEPDDAPSLVAYLAARYGPDAGPFVPSRVTSEQAVAELAPLDDGPFAGGDAARGGALFASTCSSCHGPAARGQVGVNLVDRPILRRASDVAAMVRGGRGRMLAMPRTTDAEIADLLAYLRRQKGA